MDGPRVEATIIKSWQRQHRGIIPQPKGRAAAACKRTQVVREGDGGEADDGAGRQLSVAHLQRELAKLSDCTRLRELERTLRAQCNWPQLQQSPAPTSRIRTGRSPRDETIPTTASATAALIALLILFCP